ncbi:hypothetical protein [Leptospira borgpetersenii]|uniref:hypothetical protein n=1 Tax=Leptospira borgpetersenii TaxID=174 RepID=UPI002953ADE3|nr:hypothetical protein [Leptospira borgpetersenii]
MRPALTSKLSPVRPPLHCISLLNVETPSFYEKVRNDISIACICYFSNISKKWKRRYHRF